MSLISDDALTRHLATFPGLSIGVFGDFSLDAYWSLRQSTNQVSVETGLPVVEVARQHYSPGGAGNVAANLRAMGVGHVRAIGVCGRDPFGVRLLAELDALGVDREAMQALDEPWETLVYGKPYAGETEQSRLDFGTADPLPQTVIDSLLTELAQAADSADAIIVVQQVPTGLFADQVQRRLQEIVATHPRTVFVIDARDLSMDFRGTVRKLNCREASTLFGGAAQDNLGADEAWRLPQHIADKTNAPVFVTCGEAGLLVADQSSTHHVLAVDVGPRLDTVGAGDSVTAAVAAVLAAGGTPEEAGQIASLAASISVRELRSTGASAVTPAAIAQAQHDDLIYSPWLADDPTRATRLGDTDIEVVEPESLNRARPFSHAIFDHDGTLSTLREGWELVMAPMMLKAILGPAYGKTPSTVVAALTTRIADFIDRTTGVQTLVQMQGLVELVEEYGFVPENDRLDMHGYKAIYNDLLLTRVRQRLGRLRSGQLSQEDFHIKNAIPLLAALKDAGITLHLASGTDEADVIAEANALGFGEFFGGHIYGSIGSVTHEAKRVVIERIIAENGLEGAEILTFGDGPVEMRETRKRGGLAIGVCSDEVRRFGFNDAKRRRLIRGGAQVLIPDYSDLATVLEIIGVRPHPGRTSTVTESKTR